jgi:hypothetical protein
MFFAGFYLTIQLLKITKGGKQKAWRKKRKYDSFIFLVLLPQLLPLQLFQDHRDGNLEASGIAMTCNFH